MIKRRRTPISNHPLTPAVTLMATLGGIAGMFFVAEWLGLWQFRHGRSALLLIIAPPLLILLFGYDSLTSWLDKKFEDKTDE